MSAVIEHKPESTAVAVSPAHMLQIAVERGADIDQLQKLMELHERWEKNQARKSFDAAISAAKAQIKPIIKSREVDFTTAKGRTHYMYEDLAQIASEVDPILAEFGLSYRYRSSQEGNKLTVTCVIAHRDGHSEETTLSAAYDESGNKNSIQAIGSTTTYLQRYTLKLALGLAAAKDDDAQNAGVEFITEKQAADLQAKAEEVGANIPNFLRYLKVSRFDQLPVSKYAAALRALEQKAQQK